VISPVYSMEDIVVPISQIPDTVLAINKLSAKYGIRIANFGHAGDGNIHTTLLKDNLTDQAWKRAKRNFWTNFIGRFMPGEARSPVNTA